MLLSAWMWCIFQRGNHNSNAKPTFGPDTDSPPYFGLHVLPMGSSHTTLLPVPWTCYMVTNASVMSTGRDGHLWQHSGLPGMSILQIGIRIGNPWLTMIMLLRVSPYIFWNCLLIRFKSISLLETMFLIRVPSCVPIPWTRQQRLTITTGQAFLSTSVMTDKPVWSGSGAL